LHVRTQTVCWCDTASGEQQERMLDHERDDMRAFYAQFVAPAVVGVEGSGYSLWFHRLIEETGHQLVVGDAQAIHQFARRRQKNDRRDAQLLLDLLLRGDFPVVHVPSPGSRDVLALLRYRHRLVRIRTMLRNGLQAVALSHQLRLGPRLFTARGQQQFTVLPLQGAYAAQRQHSLALLESLEERVLLTGLAVVHALDPVQRFDQARRVAAYCGLDPKEHSSGDTQRFGHISKQGNRLLRFLLVEAAHAAIGKDEPLRRFYFRIQSRKNSAVALVAVARKLVLRLYRMLREEIDYDEFRRRGRDARRARVGHSSAVRRD
jgi:transposase